MSVPHSATNSSAPRWSTPGIVSRMLTARANDNGLVTGAGALGEPSGSSPAAGVGGLRAYWHVFIAYAVVIVLVLGWVVSIGRRLKDIQQRLGE